MNIKKTVFLIFLSYHQCHIMLFNTSARMIVQVAPLRALFTRLFYHRLRATPGACLWLWRDFALRAISLRDDVSPCERM